MGGPTRRERAAGLGPCLLYTSSVKCRGWDAEGLGAGTQRTVSPSNPHRVPGLTALRVPTRGVLSGDYFLARSLASSSVSYTHLDVYKRQVQAGVGGQSNNH